MKNYLKIAGLTQVALLLVTVFFVGSVSAQSNPFIVWSQQEAENTTHNGAIAYSPDGQLVASGRADSNTVTIRNAADGALVRTLTGQNNNANVVAFSPDNQYLATGTGGGGSQLSLNLWRVSDGVRLVGRIAAFTNGTISLSFSPDSQFLAASGFHSTGYIIYHVPDMSVVGTFGNFDPELGYNARIFAVAYSNDGQFIAVGATRGIYLRRASDGSLVRIISSNYPYAMPTYSIAFSPNGTDVAAGITDDSYSTGVPTCSDCSVKLFRIADGTLLHIYTDPAKLIFPKIKFSPNGQIIGAGYSDFNGTSYSGAAQFWNVSTEQSLRRDARAFWVQDFAYSQIGNKYAFFGADGVVAVANAPGSTQFDFDGDSKADVSVFRNGTWYMQNSSAGFTGMQFGLASDKIVPADYDGDGKTDIAVYRNGVWYLQRSNLGFAAIAFGEATDILMPADFNGDGKVELTVYRPSNGTWYFYDLATAQVSATQFGVAEDKPIAADYDGDGKSDVAVYRPSNGTWYLQRSSLGFTATQFGDANDKPVCGDFDGDGKADIAVYRPSIGVWYLTRSNLGFTAIAFGISTDLPVPADYDGDGKTDVAVFRDGSWYAQRSTQGFIGTQFGVASDKPIPNSFVH